MRDQPGSGKLSPEFPPIIITKDRALARKNYSFEKRQKELAKKKKTEEKKQRKLEKRKESDEDVDTLVPEEKE